MDTRTALVTGGASGIGLAISRRLAESGSTVVIGDLDELVGRRREAQAAEAGHPVVFRRLDVASPESVESVFAGVEDEFGGVDVLVNNAGISDHHPLVDYPLDRWKRLLDVNLHGAFLCMRAAAPSMIRRGEGNVVNIASIAAERGAPGRAAYCVAKAGLVALTRVAAVEWAALGIRVNAVAPGYVDSPMLRAAVDSGAIDEAEILRRIPTARTGLAGEIADAVDFLASHRAAYITGQTLAVDGGFLADYGVGSNTIERPARPDHGSRTRPTSPPILGP